MERGWPERGPWAVAATSADVDWRLAVLGLAAGADVPVAAVVVGAALPADDPVREHLAGLAELADAGRFGLRQAHDLVRVFVKTYEIVLVIVPAGLLVPVGQGGWTLADLAGAVGAPAIVVTGPGPDWAHHTTLMLAALSGQGIAACVVTVGEVDEEALPVQPAGRVPVDAAAGLSGAAGWFDPILRGNGPRAEPEAEPDDGPDPEVFLPPTAALDRRRAVSGKRIVLGLMAVFVVMVLVVCGIAWLGGEETATSEHATAYFTTEVRPVPEVTSHTRTRTASDVCPERLGNTTVGRADASTTALVNPGQHSRVGEFYAENGTRFADWPASLSRLLNLTANALESGEPFNGHYRPKVTDGELGWDSL